MDTAIKYYICVFTIAIYVIKLFKGLKKYFLEIYIIYKLTIHQQKIMPDL